MLSTNVALHKWNKFQVLKNNLKFNKTYINYWLIKLRIWYKTQIIRIIFIGASRFELSRVLQKLKRHFRLNFNSNMIITWIYEYVKICLNFQIKNVWCVYFFYVYIIETSWTLCNWVLEIFKNNNFILSPSRARTSEDILL